MSLLNVSSCYDHLRRRRTTKSYSLSCHDSRAHSIQHRRLVNGFPLDSQLKRLLLKVSPERVHASYMLETYERPILSQARSSASNNGTVSWYISRLTIGRLSSHALSIKFYACQACLIFVRVKAQPRERGFIFERIQIRGIYVQNKCFLLSE